MPASSNSILWVTNLPAPYRFPLWNRLAEAGALRVAYMGANALNRRWAPAANEDASFSQTTLNTWSYTRGIDRPVYYVVKPLQIRRLVSAADSVVIQQWETPAAWQILFMAKLLRKPVIGFYESTLKSQKRSSGVVGAVRRRFFKLCDAVVTVGEESRAAVVSMGIPESRIIKSFNTVDVEAYQIAAKLAKPKGPGHRYIYCGQLIDRKNVGALIEAFASVSNQNDLLTIAGEGPLLDDLKSLAVSSGVSDRIAFVGYVSHEDLPDVLATNHTLVLPSTEEVWGLVVNEALATGLTTIVSKDCGVAADVADMEGVFISETTVSSLEEQLREAEKFGTDPIANPEILRYSPAAMAHDVSHAIALGRQ